MKRGDLSDSPAAPGRTNNGQLMSSPSSHAGAIISESIYLFSPFGAFNEEPHKNVTETRAEMKGSHSPNED